jgi:hypothetical protein
MTTTVITGGVAAFAIIAVAISPVGRVVRVAVQLYRGSPDA